MAIFIIDGEDDDAGSGSVCGGGGGASGGVTLQKSRMIREREVDRDKKG